MLLPKTRKNDQHCLKHGSAWLENIGPGPYPMKLYS